MSDGVPILVVQGIIQKWFETGISRALRRMYSNPILAKLAIACLAEVDWDATVVERFPCH